jgi:dephospho-CoA kinase|tara:strand:- start:1025 stop:1582 length:558 start_codon:yes stop_codon:yes gene_type:complete
MSIIGITGSIASGKSTVAYLMAGKKYPLFNADKVVSDLYKKNFFINALTKKFKLEKKKEIKIQIKLLLIKNKKNIHKLEAVIHPYVRKKMKVFLKKKNKFIFLEIPLLIESNLNKYFDKLIFVNAQRKTRLKRYLKKNGSKETFNLLDKRQLSSNVKKKLCSHTINNNYSLIALKKSVTNYMKKI